MAFTLAAHCAVMRVVRTPVGVPKKLTLDIPFPVVARAFVDLADTGAEWKLALSSVRNLTIPSPSWTSCLLSRIEQHSKLAYSRDALPLPVRFRGSNAALPLPVRSRFLGDLSWDFQRSPLHRRTPRPDAVGTCRASGARR